MITFTAYRPAPPETHTEFQKVAPDQPSYEGCIFSDGSVAIRWRTAVNSTSLWNNFDDLLRIHGHPEYGTWFEFHGDEPRMPEWWAVAREVYCDQLVAA
jgi:hypothetical protein